MSITPCLMAGACSCTPPQLERRPSALASTHATSWESADSTGRTDKTPVLIQNLPDEQRFIWTLFYPGRQHLSMLVIRNRITASAGDAPTVSLSGCMHPSARNAWSEVRVPSGSKHSVAHMYKICKVFLCLRAAILFLPGHEYRGIQKWRTLVK